MELEFFIKRVQYKIEFNVCDRMYISKMSISCSNPTADVPDKN